MRSYLRIELLFCLIALFSLSCNQEASMLLTVENTLDFDRNEVIAIEREQLLTLLGEDSEENVRVMRRSDKEYLSTQWIDYDGDGTSDEVLIQVEISANSSEEFMLSIDPMVDVPETALTTYSRFVPERTDDYTWENDRVAFRTFGPEAERMVVDGERGGTLTSGIDLWLKRVDYSIIDKWYEGYLEDANSYHVDHGEGYDPYHVGKSRGTGGIGVWLEDTLLTSRNYIAYKKIAEGPLRTVFELTYAPWSKYGIRETKRISLDLGSNFSKFEIDLTSDKEVPNYAIGITTHEGSGEVNKNTDDGWFRHWEPIDDAFLGEGVVLDPSRFDRSFINESTVPDQSQLLILTYPKNGILTYYAGFAWTKSGQVSSVEDWELLLQRQAERIESPLKVTFTP